MKFVLAITFLMFFGAQELSAQNKYVRYRTDHQEVVFLPEMNKESLDMLKNDLVNHALKLTFNDVQFGPSGGLLQITFTVKDSSGRSYEAGTDDLAKAGFFGFEFGFADGKSTVLNVGTIGILP